LINENEVDSFQIAYIGFGWNGGEGKTAGSQFPEVAFTHLIVYILSASCMPTTARHFPTVEKFKSASKPKPWSLETQLAVRSTNFLSRPGGRELEASLCRRERWGNSSLRIKPYAVHLLKPTLLGSWSQHQERINPAP
jgi:hypothetical protein